MSKIAKILSAAKGAELGNAQLALLDLRHLIERKTMNRYEEKERDDYLTAFNDKSLIDYRLDEDELNLLKYFLFFILFNFPDRAVLAAKCIKVLFDQSIQNAVCAGIKFYMKVNDDTTCELIFAITDLDNTNTFLSNKQIVDLFKDVLKYGGDYSKEAVKYYL